MEEVECPTKESGAGSRFSDRSWREEYNKKRLVIFFPEKVRYENSSLI
jgi:hypothetical protein